MIGDEMIGLTVCRAAPCVTGGELCNGHERAPCLCMAGSVPPPGGSRPLRLSVLLPLLHPAVYTERVLLHLDRALHADGYARASEAHRLPHEVRVDLSAVAINAIADSVIVDGSELPRGASLYEYLAHAGAGQRGELRHQALWRYFGACASRRVLPLEAMPLLEHILAAKDRQTLDAYIQACARSGNVDEAFTAHERSLLTPDHPPPNGHTITALVAACSSANQLDRAFAIVDSGRRYGNPS